MKINIAFSIDDHYTKHLLVTITSILYHNHQHCFDFYILGFDLTEQSKQYIQSIIREKDTVTFIDVKDDFDIFPNQSMPHISHAAYGRLNLAKYLSHLDKILYLDVDILVNRNLSDLWQLDITHHYAAVAVDVNVLLFMKEHTKLLDIDDTHLYFNSGVMLINLQQWRNLDIFQHSLNWLNQMQGKVCFEDQDALNFLCQNKVMYLDCRYNYILEQKPIYDILNTTIKPDFLDFQAHDILIYHYAGPSKAWHKDCPYDNAHLYWYFADMVMSRLYGHLGQVPNLY